MRFKVHYVVLFYPRFIALGNLYINVEVYIRLSRYLTELGEVDTSPNIQAIHSEYPNLLS